MESQEQTATNVPGTWSIVEHLLLVLSVIAAAAAAAVVVVTAVATVAAAIATVHAVVAAWCFCHMVCSRVKLGITHSSAECITVGHASDADIASASEGMGLQDSCKCSCAWLIMHFSPTCQSVLRETNLHKTPLVNKVMQASISCADCAAAPCHCTNYCCWLRIWGAKCRCWSYSTHLGDNSHHPDLCERCTPVIQQTGFVPAAQATAATH